MIDPNLQAELRAKYNPDGSNLREMQLRMLDMLKYVDEICTQNNITWWLSSGTCLGAVRHGGFIPWDDDVDIEMPFDDYCKLLKILAESNEHYALQNHDTEPNYLMPAAKLRDRHTIIEETFGVDALYKEKGIFIDLFPMVKSNSKRLHYICGRLNVLEMYIQRWSLTGPKIIKPIPRLVHAMNTLIFRLCKPFDHIGKISYFRHALGSSFIIPRKITSCLPVTRLKFEDTMLPVPGDYDEYLSRMFGDYMTLKMDHVHIKSNFKFI